MGLHPEVSSFPARLIEIAGKSALNFFLIKDAMIEMGE
jgi:hypothetical protein